ncbi:MAG TPA: hypothetical protein PKE17_18955 [Saprospiraceae bacterium]|nr:hypothetical protein [Saprospiraceae bacterium]
MHLKALLRVSVFLLVTTLMWGCDSDSGGGGGSIEGIWIIDQSIYFYGKNNPPLNYSTQAEITNLEAGRFDIIIGGYIMKGTLSGTSISWKDYRGTLLDNNTIVDGVVGNSGGNYGTFTANKQ